MCTIRGLLVLLLTENCGAKNKLMIYASAKF